MNVFQSLYCNQYAELVKTGRDENKARTNGLLLSAVCITLNILTLFYLLFVSNDVVSNWIENFTIGLDGKSMGKLLGVVVIGIVWLILRYTIGTEMYFKNAIEQYNASGEVDKKSINKKAMIYCFGSVAIFIAVVFLA